MYLTKNKIPQLNYKLFVSLCFEEWCWQEMKCEVYSPAHMTPGASVSGQEHFVKIILPTL